LEAIDSPGEESVDGGREVTHCGDPRDRGVRQRDAKLVLDVSDEDKQIQRVDA